VVLPDVDYQHRILWWALPLTWKVWRDHKGNFSVEDNQEGCIELLSYYPGGGGVGRGWGVWLPAQAADARQRELDFVLCILGDDVLCLKGNFYSIKELTVLYPRLIEHS